VTRRTSAKELRRRAPIRPELRTVVVFVEGETEADYMGALMRLLEVSEVTTLMVELDPSRGLAPLQMVQSAARRLKDREVNQCWCVFDVEWPRHHPHLSEARQLAQKSKVRLAISNPCFELWLILRPSARRSP